MVMNIVELIREMQTLTDKLVLNNSIHALKQ